jgi:hypothetical protein
LEDFSARLGLRDSLELFLFLRSREAELAGAPDRLFASLRAYLYGRLSIEEMESPEALLERIKLGD